MTTAESNHSSCPTTHTGLRQSESVCQVERLNVPLEEKLTAKPDRGEAQFCLLSSMQPFFSFNLTLPFKQNEKLDLCLEQISHPRLKFWDPAEVRCFWKSSETSQEQKGGGRSTLKSPSGVGDGVGGSHSLRKILLDWLTLKVNSTQTIQWQQVQTDSGTLAWHGSVVGEKLSC